MPARSLSIGAHVYDVQLARHPRARRYVLRLAANGALRLTIPRGASIAGGLAFARRQSRWIERERVRATCRAQPWTEGTEIWWRGERIAAARLAPADVLATTGDWRPALEAHLLEIARQELPAQCLALAAQHGLAVARVSVRNQRSRWGACSPRGVITLNWRLVQMPPSVTEYVLLHELMHLRQANHSRRFWREVERVCAGWRDAEAWLRRHGRELI